MAAICDARGNPSEALPGREATLAVGAHVGANIVVATPNGYIGYQVAGAEQDVVVAGGSIVCGAGGQAAGGQSTTTDPPTRMLALTGAVATTQ